MREFKTQAKLYTGYWPTRRRFVMQLETSMMDGTIIRNRRWSKQEAIWQETTQQVFNAGQEETRNVMVTSGNMLFLPPPLSYELFGLILVWMALKPFEKCSCHEFRFRIHIADSTDQTRMQHNRNTESSFRSWYADAKGASLSICEKWIWGDDCPYIWQKYNILCTEE